MEKQYAVIWSEQARRDLMNTAYYYTVNLDAPSVAGRILDALEEAGRSLSSFPYRCPLVQYGPVQHLELHSMLVKKHYLYYQIRESDATVTILAVSHVLQNQTPILRRLDET